MVSAARGRVILGFIGNLLGHLKTFLCIRLQSIVRNLDAGDALELLALIQGNTALKARIISEITRFLHSEMNLSLAGN